MSYEILISIIRKRRSIRKYNTESISEDYIEKILEAARWAPCGANLQPWEIIVVRDKAKVRIIKEEIYRTKNQINQSVFFIVCGDERMKEYYPSQHTKRMREYTFTVSIAASIQNMLLVATALNLGSLWRTVFTTQARALKKLLNIPKFIRIMSVIEIGYPLEETSIPQKRNIKNFSHIDQFDKEKIIDSKDAWLERSIHSPRYLKNK